MNFIGNKLAIERLINELNQYEILYIGVDFDDTIRDYNTGDIISPVVKVLKEFSEYGHKICLYTCREDSELAYAINFCKAIGLKIDYVNHSPVIPGIRKPLFNILLDDRCGLNESLETCNSLLEYIRNR